MGDIITYTDTIENTGDSVLTNVVISENLEGTFKEDENLTINGSSATLDRLEVGAKYEVTYSVEVPEGTEVESIVSVVTDEGVSAEANATVKVIHPSIKVFSTADKDECISLDDIVYTEVVKNTGDTTITDIRVSEDVEGVYSSEVGVVEDGALVIPMLKPNESVTFTYTVEAINVDEETVFTKTLKAEAEGAEE